MASGEARADEQHIAHGSLRVHEKSESHADEGANGDLGKDCTAQDGLLSAIYSYAANLNAEQHNGENGAGLANEITRDEHRFGNGYTQCVDSNGESGRIDQGQFKYARQRLERPLSASCSDIHTQRRCNILP